MKGQAVRWARLRRGMISRGSACGLVVVTVAVFAPRCEAFVYRSADLKQAVSVEVIES